MQVTEVFLSIQGEGRRMGVPTTFVRTTGCHLRCTWCDAAYAFHGGTRRSVDEVMALEGKEIQQFPPPVNLGEIAPWAKAEPTSPSPSSSPSPTSTPDCRPGQPNQRPECQTRTPAPTNTPTPPPSQGQPCNQLGMPVGCDPNLPPEGDKSWWCAQPEHRDHPACRDQEEPDDPNGGPGRSN